MTSFFLTVALAASPSADDLLTVARESYLSGLREQTDRTRAQPHFARAAVAYEWAWDEGRQTDAVARNMAQSRLLADDLGKSIRNYRRGLKVYPHDAELRRGLAFAREQVAYSHSSDLADLARAREVVSAFDRLSISLRHLGLMAVSLAALGWLMLARAWMSRRAGLALFGGVAVLVAALVGGGLWWENTQARQRWSEPTAVLTAPADLRTGNSTEYPRRIDGRLPAGVEVKVLGERGGWLQVELAGGMVGWIQTDQTALVN